MSGEVEGTAVAIIDLRGCDDTTRIVMPVTDAELEFLHRMAEESRKASDYACMPTMSVVVGSQGD